MRLSTAMGFLLLFLLLPVCMECPSAGRARAEFDPYSFEVTDNEPVWTESSYTSDRVTVTVSSRWAGHSDVYVCDIRIANTECLRRAFGGDKWGTETERIGAIAERNEAVLAITGDNSAYISSGMIVGNGEVIRNTANIRRDVGVIYRNGVMRTYVATENSMGSLYREFAADPNVWQVFLFGPALLDGAGHALESFNSNVYPANPRSVIGYFEPGHYCFVQVDGRGVDSALEKGRRSTGLTLSELAAFMESLGCTAAYNLDGGQSSALWFGGSIISTPYKGGRKLGDIVYIADLPARSGDTVIR